MVDFDLSRMVNTNGFNDGMPVVRLEIERMKTSILNAFVDHSGQVNKIVEETINKMLSGEHFVKTIEAEVQRVVSDTTVRCIKQYFGSGDGYEAIKEAVESCFLKPEAK